MCQAGQLTVWSAKIAQRLQTRCGSIWLIGLTNASQPFDGFDLLPDEGCSLSIATKRNTLFNWVHTLNGCSMDSGPTKFLRISASGTARSGREYADPTQAKQASWATSKSARCSLPFAETASRDRLSPLRITYPNLRNSSLGWSTNSPSPTGHTPPPRPPARSRCRRASTPRTLRR